MLQSIARAANHIAAASNQERPLFHCCSDSSTTPQVKFVKSPTASAGKIFINHRSGSMPVGGPHFGCSTTIEDSRKYIVASIKLKVTRITFAGLVSPSQATVTMYLLHQVESDADRSHVYDISSPTRVLPVTTLRLRRRDRYCGFGETLRPAESAGELHHQKERHDSTDRDRKPAEPLIEER